MSQESSRVLLWVSNETPSESCRSLAVLWPSRGGGLSILQKSQIPLAGGGGWEGGGVGGWLLIKITASKTTEHPKHVLGSRYIEPSDKVETKMQWVSKNL